MTISKELKEAISQLHPEEKDKLIFRLLKKDVQLANQLYFELLANESREDRREKAQKKIEEWISVYKRSNHYSTPGILLMYMRDASGYVNEHVKTTKDKYGEVYLQIFVLKKFLQIYNELFLNASPDRSYTLNIYMTAKTFKIMVLLKKMHEDYLIDFVDDLEAAGRLFGQNPSLMKVAIRNGLDVNWLINGDIPDNIAEIEKDLRQRGYLK
ncbi:MAG: hypothetical protein LBE91_11070 [Tannerella sp.]|jgi:hypothetical protein|nr:hypothetical protein [Tannerella sp.]